MHPCPFTRPSMPVRRHTLSFHACEAPRLSESNRRCRVHLFLGFPPLWASDTCLPIFPPPPLILRTWVIGSSLPSTSSYLSDPLSGQPVLFGPSNLLGVGLAGRVGEGTTGRPSTDRETQQDHVTDLRRTCTCQGEPWPGWSKGGKCGLLCTGLTGRERTQGDGQEEKKKPAKMKLGQNNQFFYDEKVRQAYARTKVERKDRSRTSRRNRS